MATLFGKDYEEITGMSTEDLDAFTPGTPEYEERMKGSSNLDAGDELQRMAVKEAEAKNAKRKKAEKSESGLYFKDGKAYFAKPYDRGFTMQDVAGNTPMQDRMIAQNKRRSDETRANVREQYARLPQTIDSYLAQMRLKENPPKAKKEEFVAKDTLLGRIFDKRIKPGEDISNRDKASAMLRNISDNLLERRLVGGKEGTDTMSRILGPSGGIREGMEEIEALESAAQAKNLETILADQKYRKSEADIKKVMADTALQEAGINTENMDSDTKFAYYQTLAELGSSNINSPMFQKKLLENMKKQQSVEILDNIGPEYTKALDALRVETPGTPAHDRALKMLQLYGQYLPGLEDMAEEKNIQSQDEVLKS